MIKKKLALNNPVALEEYFGTLTGNALMENSAMVYAAGYDNKLNELENLFRYDRNITLETLNLELNKVEGLISHVKSSPNPNELEPKLVKMKNVLESRIKRDSNNKFYVSESMIRILEKEVIHYNDGMDCVGVGLVDKPTFESLYSVLEYLSDGNDKLITPIEITKSAQAIALMEPAEDDKDEDDDLIIYDDEKDDDHHEDDDEDCEYCYNIDGVKSKPFDESLKKECIHALADKICNTVKYELNHKDLQDLPIVQSIDDIKDYLKGVYDDCKDVLDNIDDIFDDIEKIVGDECRKDIKTTMESVDITPIHSVAPNFSPNPNNVYTLTPFDGSSTKDLIQRKLVRTMADLMTTELDEELKECLLEFGRIKTIIEKTGAYNETPINDMEPLEESYSSYEEVLYEASILMQEDIESGKFEASKRDITDRINNCNTIGDVKTVRRDIYRAIKKLQKYGTKYPQRYGDYRSMINWLQNDALRQIDKKADSVTFEGYEYDDAIDYVIEASNPIAKGARTASRAVQNGVGKATHKISGTGKDIKVATKKATDPMANFVEDTVRKFKEADDAQRREIILKGRTEGTILKVWRWVKRGIVAIIALQFGGSIGALIAGIGLVTSFVTDKYCDSKVRTQMLHEMESELKIVNEKIDDSRGDEDKQKKYELMRIKTQLEKDIQKIKLRLNY